MDDPYDLERFLDAQAPVLDRVRAELRSGCKKSHWMWFIFPQIAGLGHSPTAVRYAISSAGEARAYLAHPVLGPRLLDCTRLVNDVEGRSIEAIFGYPDTLKFKSSMTLFASVAEGEPVFRQALDKYFASDVDRATLDRL
jgi:uncharacterized protein (DUF1810 family)